MIEPAYHFCPRCGGQLEITKHEGQDMQSCSVCHEILFKNQNICTDGIIIRDGQMLLARRAREPRKGFLDFPGGYVNPGESIAAGMLREIKEELNVEAKIVRLLGVYGPNVYPYREVLNYNSSAFYLLDIGNGKPEAGDDVASVEWWPLVKLPDPELMAFSSQRDFLIDLKMQKVKLSEEQ